jgi:hypothetical protein
VFSAWSSPGSDQNPVSIDEDGVAAHDADDVFLDEVRQPTRKILAPDGRPRVKEGRVTGVKMLEDATTRLCAHGNGRPAT